MVFQFILILLFIKHSICPKFATKSQIYLKFGYFCQVSTETFIIFQNWHNFLNYSQGKYLPTMISGKNSAREQKAGVNKTEIFHKIAKNQLIFVNKMYKFKYYVIFQHIFVFHKEGMFGFHDFRQKDGHRTNSCSEHGKNLTKNCRKMLIFLYKMQ